MAKAFANITFTPAVRAAQTQHGSRRSYEALERGEPTADRLGPHEREFIAERDGFYQATVSESLWPYVQFRGGAPGFLRVLDERTLGYADFRGNRQYLSLGNLSANDRIMLFLMDYAQARRLKIWGRAQIVEDPVVIGQLVLAGYPAKVERAVVITVEAFDWNCSQHIPQRFTRGELELLGPQVLEGMLEGQRTGQP